MKKNLFSRACMIIIAFLLFGLSATTTFTSCDDNEEIETGKDPGQDPDDDDQQQSIYTPEMFFGVWKLTESVFGGNYEIYDDPNDEWQKIFYSDQWENNIGEGQDRHYQNGGFSWSSDFKWWLGRNNELHTLEYDTGNEFVLEVSFEDGGNTLLIREGEYLDRYVKVR